MFDPDLERKKALIERMNDPATSAEEALELANELLDLEDPALVQELARQHIAAAAAVLKEIAENADDPVFRQQAAETLKTLHDFRRDHG
ncbi:hypothetical protein PAGU2196_34920 [Pseudomonas sp. PAGU 2196]|uniref:hypothetical protein n=1 Tax=Pseudomonas sp. PAGU 2196 TaxID=2793997 RepID=UPI001EDCBA9A|nr:hypothetical protein [Pseudomonas sp. PAGU 2196]GHS82658.1 hypothetical protein PAGU2196_34920 [Pseudomonas sp. PAGU 2196]